MFIFFLLSIQAALLQKLKGQVGSEKMLDLMMTLLKPGQGGAGGPPPLPSSSSESERSGGVGPETGNGSQALHMEGAAR